jgi:hypothetical protein
MSTYSSFCVHHASEFCIKLGLKNPSNEITQLSCDGKAYHRERRFFHTNPGNHKKGFDPSLKPATIIQIPYLKRTDI